MKKRIFAVSVLLAFVLSIFTGCGEKSSVVTLEEPDRETITLTFFGNKYEPENVKIIEEILSDFMVENPDIRVSYESIKGKEYFDALKKRMAAGKGSDVFMVNHDVLLELEQQGQVADLSDLSTISSFTDRMCSQMEQNGEIYWVPLQLGSAEGARPASAG